MPYILPQKRIPLDPHLIKLIDEIKKEDEKGQAGAATYSIYMILVALYGKASSRWYDRSEVFKILRSAEMEFYMHHLYGYELQKIAENGDVS